MSQLQLDRSVADLVNENPARSAVFEKYNIDYCCGGSHTLDEACRAVGADADRLLAELEQCTATDDSRQEWTAATLSELCDHIVAKHHAYLARELPSLTELLDRVIEAHAGRHPELVRLGEVFAALRAELETHMMKEERVLFPIIKELERASAAGASCPQFHCGSVNNPIAVMEDDHHRAAAALREIRSLTSGFKPPEDACEAFRALYSRLNTLEQDLHLHIHKENNLLFPKAAELESQLSLSR